jgi:hypothetical protein
VITKLKSKQDAIAAMNQKEVTFLEEIELVNDSDVKKFDDKVRGLIRSKKKLHAILIERL